MHTCTNIHTYLNGFASVGVCRVGFEVCNEALQLLGGYGYLQVLDLT